jgi:hypothetical protein
MGELYDTWKEMSTEKVAEEEVAIDDGQEILAKFAETADVLLEEEFGEDYDANDVEKLAGLLIEHAQNEELMQEKIAEMDDFADIVAEKVAGMFVEEYEED